MTIDRALVLAVVMSAISASGSGPALAQACTRQGTDVSCDDGRRGIFAGDAIVWADGTRSSLTSPHPSVIIGNKSLVIVGQGVFVGHGKGSSPAEESGRAGQSALPHSRWRVVLLLMIARAGVDRTKRPKFRRAGQRRIARLVGPGLLQGVDEIGEPALDRAAGEFCHHRFPAHTPLGQ